MPHRQQSQRPLASEPQLGAVSQSIAHDRRHGMHETVEEQREKKYSIKTKFFATASLDTADQFLTLIF
jgi:hypothetical protein